jgi:hypothetical protein
MAAVMKTSGLAGLLTEADITLVCVSNEVGGTYNGNARWLGVPLAGLLRRAGVQAGAGELIAERAPLIKAILRALNATEDGTLREGFFLDLLRRGFSADEARRQLDIAIEWGRYGELFEYDAESGQLVLGSDPAKVRA